MTNQETHLDRLTVASIIRDARARTYRTAKDFWEQHEDALNTSYPHYSAIESGKKFPEIKLLISIAKILKMDLRLACHIWTREQMPTPETKSFFEPIPGFETKGIPSAFKNNLDQFYVFTEAQLPALEGNPALWETLSFITAFSPSSQLTEQDISNSLQVNPKEISDAVEWLRNEGLVYAEKGALKTKRLFYHLPNTPDFKKLRDQNFQRANQWILKNITSESIAKKTAFRTVYMRRVTEKQAEEITEKIDNLIGHLGNLDELGSDLYSLTVGFAPRSSFKKKKTS